MKQVRPVKLDLENTEDHKELAKDLSIALTQIYTNVFNIHSILKGVGEKEGDLIDITTFRDLLDVLVGSVVSGASAHGFSLLMYPDSKDEITHVRKAFKKFVDHLKIEMDVTSVYDEDIREQYGDNDKVAKG